MPRIDKIGNLVIWMYHQDHKPPHFHVVGPDIYAKITIGDGLVLEGNLPKRTLKRVFAWAGKNENRRLLEEKWAELSE